MREIKDRIGDRFDRLLVVAFLETRNGKTYWKALCDCGKVCVARGDKLVSGEKNRVVVSG